MNADQSPERAMAIRVLQIIPSMGMGGAERMIVDLLRSLEPVDAFEFLVCCVEDVKWYFQYTPARLPVCLHHRGPWRDWAGLRQTVSRLRSVLEEFQPHVIHSHLWFADFVAALANRIEKIPHIVHFHDTCDWKTSRRMGFRVRRWIYSRMLRRSHVRFVSCSEIVARLHKESLGIVPSRVKVIPYGIDCALFRPVRNSRPQQVLRVGTVGRFVPMKGHRYLFEAFSRLIKVGKKGIKLVVAGDGPLRGNYEGWIEELGITDCVELRGAIQNVPEFLQSLDVYVQSSSSEALPIAVLEAMACGLPIVATRVAGIPEQIDEGVNGRLVAPCDSLALAKALQELCENPALRERFGTASGERARKLFSIETMTHRLGELYRALAHGAAATSVPQTTP